MLLLTVVGMAYFAMQNNSVYFYTPSEAVEKSSYLSKQQIKLGGMVKANSVHWNADNLKLNFVVTDLKGVEIVVQHRGAPPDMFKENSGVVMDGQIDSVGKSFIAYKLMVKHSEEYKIPGDPHSKDTKLIQKSLFKEDNSKT